MIDLTTVASGTTILMGAAYVGRSILRAAGTVRENTKATQELSGKLEALSTNTATKLAEHETRIQALESHRA